MLKGHRRTQSSNLATCIAETTPFVDRSEIPLAGHEIVSWLTKSTDKVKEKVSNVEVLHSQSVPENGFFNFGKTSNRNSENSRSRHPDEEYMMGSPSELEAARITQESEINHPNIKPFGKKEKTGIGVVQGLPRCHRMPFTNTLNYFQYNRKPLEGKEGGPKRDMRLKKGEDKRRQ